MYTLNLYVFYYPLHHIRHSPYILRNLFFTNTFQPPTQRAVVNLSDFTLTPDMISLLSRGLNFCPTPGEPDMGKLRSELNTFHRKLRLRAYFGNEEDSVLDRTNDLSQDTNDMAFADRKFKPRSTFNPNGPIQLEAFIAANETALSKTHCTAPTNTNLSEGEKTALTKLRENRSITIKKADKGSAVVVLNTKDYIAQTLRLLDNREHYRVDATCQTTIHNDLIIEILDAMFEMEEISAETYEYLINRTPRTPLFYSLPKIHKGTIPPPGRPIVSGNDSASERISQFVDHFLQPIVPKTKSYIKDTSDFVKFIRDLGPIPTGSILATLDVSALYTNIPHDEGEEAALNALIKERGPSAKPSNTFLSELLHLVLTTNNFEFDGIHYTQLSGTAMGTKVAPSYANIFMDWFEQTYVYTHALCPTIWFRYIDDVFTIFNCDITDATTFLRDLNSCHASIKFESELSETEINFLDTTVMLHDNTVSTKVYSKPTDSFSYLHFDSCHPKHCKSNLPYGQFLRVKRICTNISDFDDKAREMARHFIRRGYPIETVENALIKARRIDRDVALTPKEPDVDTQRATFLVTPHDPVTNIVANVVNSNWDILARSCQTRAIHEKRFICGYRRTQNLKEMLTSARVKSTTDAPPRRSSTATSGNRCTFRACRFCPIIDHSGRITSHFSKREYVCKARVDCRNNNIIYCISCTKCGMQYVGQTQNALCDRFHTHFWNINKAHTNHSVSRHFNQPGHSGVGDVKIHILDFIYVHATSAYGKSVRDTVEKHWIHRLRSQTPLGMNIED